jgi:putative membrane protein
MTLESADPRVYFAAERTLLAWVRTGIGVMAFGFVVARFGLFIRLLREQGAQTNVHGASPVIGAVLVLLGVLATLAGAVQFRRFIATLAPEELPSGRAQVLPLALAAAIAFVGGVLAVILMVDRPR